MTVGRIPSVEGGIQPTIFDAKADLLTATANDTPARLAVGTNGQVLTADSTAGTGLSWATLPASGKILQVVVGSTNTLTSSSSASYADTTLTATITPTSATSTILVMLSQQVSKSAANAATSCNLRLYRGATNLRQMSTDTAYTNSTLKIIGWTFAHNYLDTPATTSATTYKTQFSNPNAVAQIDLQDSAFSTIVLMEIGA
jgi:hypothetical protein